MPAHAKRPNLFITIPCTRVGIPAIEESIFAGVPVNVTLLFSREHCIAAGRDLRVASVASVFVSRWDVAVKDEVPDALRNRLGIAVAVRTYKTHHKLLGSSRWQDIAARGALPQRVLWGNTATKDPMAPGSLHVEALAAPDTINTMPEKTLLAFAGHGEVKGAMPSGGGDAEVVLAALAATGVKADLLAADLQREGTAAFAKSQEQLMLPIASKRRLP